MTQPLDLRRAGIAVPLVAVALCATLAGCQRRDATTTAPSGTSTTPSTTTTAPPPAPSTGTSAPSDAASMPMAPASAASQ